MKRVIAATAILLGVVAICIAEHITVERFCERKKDELTKIQSLYTSDRNKSFKQAEKFKEEWEDEHVLLMFFVNHSLVEDISEESTKLPSYAKAGSDADFYADCAAIIRCLNQIKTDQTVTFDTFY